MNIKKLAAAGTLAAVMMLPAITAAEATTTNPLQGQALSLMQQIQALQNQLKALLSQAGSSTKNMIGGMGMGDDMNRGQMGKAVCIELKRSLKQGMQGDDVKSLQEMLSDDPTSGFTGKATGFFGPMTAKAVKKFQMNNGIASSSDGTVGPMTRGFFERRCGKGLGDGVGDNMKGKMGQMNVLMIMGTIASFDGTTLVVSGPNNDSKSFTVSTATKIEIGHGTSSPATAGTTADLTVGAKVMVDGAKGDSSTPVAEHIRVGEFPMPGAGKMQIPGMGLLKNLMWNNDDKKGPGEPATGGSNGPMPQVQN